MSIQAGTIIGPGTKIQPSGVGGPVGPQGEEGERGLQGERGPTGPRGDPNLVPTGTMLPFGGQVIPAGWLACDGASYSVSAYPALHAVIGYDFGGGGVTFNVPDTRARALVGAGGLDTEPAWAWNVGQKGGVRQVALALAEIPAHLHNIYLDHYHQVDFNHNHTVAVNAHNHGDPTHSHTHIRNGVWPPPRHWDPSPGSTGLGTPNLWTYTHSGAARHNAGNPGGWTNYVSEMASGWHVRNTNWQSQMHGAADAYRNTDNRGSGQAHDNVQPSLGATYLIKT